MLRPIPIVAFEVFLIAVGTEALFYIDSDRHATIRELTVATTLGLIYFSLLEVMIAKRFIIGRADSWLCYWLRFQGGGIFKVMETLNDPTNSWTNAAAGFFFALILWGLIGASLDAWLDYRQREKDSQLT